MLEREFKFYKDNKENFDKLYDGKFIAIIGEEVTGVFDDELTAYSETKKEHAVGTFLIQQCSSKADNHVQRYHSRVAFR